LENSTLCKEIYRKIPILMLESVGNFHCGYWNVSEMSIVPVDIHMLENSVSPVVWSCDIHYILMLEFCISPCNSVEGTIRQETYVGRLSYPWPLRSTYLWSYPSLKLFTPCFHMQQRSKALNLNISMNLKAI
jgi:hypothetical protein